MASKKPRIARDGRVSPGYVALAPEELASVPVVTLDEVKDHSRIRRAMPSWGDIKDAFGLTAVETGKVNLDLETRDGRKNRIKMMDLMRPANRLEGERGQKVQAGIERTTLRDRDGRTMQVPVHMEERKARQLGLTAVPRRKATHIYRDGQWYRWVSEKGAWIIE